MRVRVRVRVTVRVRGESESKGESESAVIDVVNNGRISPSCCREGWGQSRHRIPLHS